MKEQYREIGSEFWLNDLHDKSDSVHLLSGRTAIDLILQDLNATGLEAKHVYMPAWCCDSMIQPFKERGVSIKFYDVSFKDGHLFYDIDENCPVDIFYVTNYFGYNSTLPIETVIQFKQYGATVINDRTHSLLMTDDLIDSIADYSFGSIRKWMGVVSGAYLNKREGILNVPELGVFPYMTDRIEAMKMKAAYMSGNKTVNKKEFLDKYSQFAHHLEEDYRNYRMDEESLNMWLHADKQTLKNARRNNAMMLQKLLEGLPQMKLMFSMEKDNCPLFVPVLLSNKEERDAMRRHLTTKAIYCPIHWPKPVFIDASMKVNTIYDCELSLLCDQRYGYEDMQRIINVIMGFYKF